MLLLLLFRRILRWCLTEDWVVSVDDNVVVSEGVSVLRVVSLARTSKGGGGGGGSWTLSCPPGTASTSVNGRVLLTTTTNDRVRAFRWVHCRVAFGNVCALVGHSRCRNNCRSVSAWWPRRREAPWLVEAEWITTLAAWLISRWFAININITNITIVITTHRLICLCVQCTAVNMTDYPVVNVLCLFQMATD